MLMRVTSRPTKAYQVFEVSLEREVPEDNEVLKEALIQEANALACKGLKGLTDS